MTTTCASSPPRSSGSPRAGGEVALVAAEAGGGKTSLVRQAAEDAQRDHGAALWWGSCDHLRSPRPLGPLIDVASSAGGPLARAIADGSERQQLFDAAVDALRSSVDTVLLVIEDLHWADDATLDFVTFLARRVVGAPVLLVLTYRDDEVVGSHPTLPVLSEIGASVHVRCRLAPLTGAALGRADPRVVDRPRRAAPPHRRQPVLRHRDAGRRRR